MVKDILTPTVEATNRIGLLWDSASDNMGDIAIGLLLQRAFAQARIPFCNINPFEPNLTDVSTLLIGGGELIRTAGNLYYDVFRASGRHILNTVGVLDGTHTDYLDEYRLVSVRSQADHTRLGRGEVVPCLTLLYNDYIPQNYDVLPDIPPGAIGINVNYGFYKHIEPLALWVRKAGLGPIVWLPITHYNGDRLLLQHLADYIPHSILLPPLPPDAVFRTIGKLSALVSCSLHAALFAYTQGIPVLGFANVRKLAAFLEERQQGDAVFTSAEDIKRVLPRVLDTPRDLSSWRQQDDAACRRWLAQIVAETDRALSESPVDKRIVLTPASAHHHELEMTSYLQAGTQYAANLRRSLQTAALRSTFLGRLAINVKQRIFAVLRKIRSAIYFRFR